MPIVKWSIPIIGKKTLYGVDNCWAGAVCWFFTGVYHAARQCFLITIFLFSTYCNSALPPVVSGLIH